MRSSRVLTLFAFVGGFTIAACSDRVADPAVSNTAMIYLVLSPDSIEPGDSLVSALIAIPGSATEATYLHPDRFGMRRKTDGAVFAFNERRELTGAIPLQPSATGIRVPGNFILSQTRGAGGLGRDSITPGSTFVLDLVAQGVSASAEVTVPDRPVPLRRVVGGRVRITWRPARGAAMYLVGDATGSGVFVNDTTFDTDGPSPVYVAALDSNLTAFLVRDTISRAGVVGAYGVVGAKMVGRVRDETP